MYMYWMRDLFETRMQWVWEVSRTRFSLENDCGYGIGTFQDAVVDQLWYYRDMILLSESTETDVNTDQVVRPKWVCWAHVAESDPHDSQEDYYHERVVSVLEVVERQTHYNIYQNMDREGKLGHWQIRFLTSIEVDIQRLMDKRNCATVAVAALS
jgi:hypothetical protein